MKRWFEKVVRAVGVVALLIVALLVFGWTGCAGPGGYDDPPHALHSHAGV
jgi:hypothetical protein